MKGSCCPPLLVYQAYTEENQAAAESNYNLRQRRNHIFLHMLPASTPLSSTTVTPKLLLPANAEIAAAAESFCLLPKKEEEIERAATKTDKAAI